MPTLYDARGNEILSTFPDQITNGVITDNRPVSALLGVLNSEVLMDLNGAKTATFDVRSGAGALTFLVEASIDGTNYFAVPIFAINQLLVAVQVTEVFVPSVVVATTINAQYTVDVSGYRRVRLRVSAYTSGNITVAARASIADLVGYARQIPTTSFVTATAAANTLATATLPAAGVGMFHYITSIMLMRSATAVLAGTATIIHTSTNLPGSPAWSVGNAMAAGGT